MRRFDTLKVSEWIARILLWVGVALPVAAVLVTVVVGYAVLWRLGGPWASGIFALFQLLCWFLSRSNWAENEKLERKLVRFYTAKLPFALTLVLLFVAAPPVAWFVLDDWQPAALVYGSTVGAIALGTGAMELAKTITDSFSNYPFH